MSAYEWITFMTDYGLENKFTGVCRGAFAKTAPAARVLDITHLVPRGDVRHGAAVLQQAVSYLPQAVHLAVVDPGVGTARRPIAITSGGCVFVGPDNGLLLPAAEALGGVEVAHELTENWFRLRPLSSTFHGRDLFAPAAAHIAAGAVLARLGPEVPVASLVQPPVPTLVVRADTIDGEILIVDRFGNAQTSITALALESISVNKGHELEITSANRSSKVPFVDTFGSVSAGTLLTHIDSAGLLAVAVNCGDAALELALTEGASITVRRIGQ